MVQNIVRIAHVMELEEEKECVARVAKRVVKDEKKDSSCHDKTHFDTTQHNMTRHNMISYLNSAILSVLRSRSERENRKYRFRTVWRTFSNALKSVELFSVKLSGMKSNSKSCEEENKRERE
jgi:hypothetical protein